MKGSKYQGIICVGGAVAMVGTYMLDPGGKIDHEIVQIAAGANATTTSASISISFNLQPFDLPGESKLLTEAPAITYPGALPKSRR